MDGGSLAGNDCLRVSSVPASRRSRSRSRAQPGKAVPVPTVMHASTTSSDHSPAACSGPPSLLPCDDPPARTPAQEESADPDKISSFMNIRVADIQACYELWKGRGAEFITEPIVKYGEIRCYIRDPDGYIIEVGQSTELKYG